MSHPASPASSCRRTGRRPFDDRDGRHEDRGDRGQRADRQQLTKDLADKGHEAIAASPSTGVNALTGEGLAGVLAGPRVVGRRRETRPPSNPLRCVAFFERSSRNLLAAAAGRHPAPRRSLDRRHGPPRRERIFSGEGGAGAADRGKRRALHDRARDAVSSSSSARSPRPPSRGRSARRARCRFPADRRGRRCGGPSPTWRSGARQRDDRGCRAVQGTVPHLRRPPHCGLRRRPSCHGRPGGALFSAPAGAGIPRPRGPSRARLGSTRFATWLATPEPDGDPSCARRFLRKTLLLKTLLGSASSPGFLGDRSSGRRRRPAGGRGPGHPDLRPSPADRARKKPALGPRRVRARRILPRPPSCSLRLHHRDGDRGRDPKPRQ